MRPLGNWEPARAARQLASGTGPLRLSSRQLLDHALFVGRETVTWWRRESAAGSSADRKCHGGDDARAERQVIRTDELGSQRVPPGLDAADGLLGHAVVAGYRRDRNDLAVEVQVDVSR